MTSTSSSPTASRLSSAYDCILFNDYNNDDVNNNNNNNNVNNNVNVNNSNNNNNNNNNNSNDCYYNYICDSDNELPF